MSASAQGGGPATSRAAQHAAERLAQRGHELGLALYRRDQRGQVTLLPVHSRDTPTADWLATPELTRLIAEASDSCLHNDDPQPVALCEGCRLIPVIERRGSLTIGLLLGLTLWGPFVHTRTFARLCAAAGMTTEEARLALRRHLRPAEPDLEVLASTLRWSHADLVRANLHTAAIDEFKVNLVQSYEEVNLLYRLARLMNTTGTPGEAARSACKQIKDILPFTWVALCFRDDTEDVSQLSGTAVIAGALPCDRVRFGQVVHQLLKTAGTADWPHLMAVDRHELAALVGAEVIARPIVHDGRIVAALLAGNKVAQDPEVSSVETQFLDAAADFLSVFHENMARFQEQRSMFIGTLGALTASIDAKDRYTLGHSERVSYLGWGLAARLNMDARVFEQVRIAGLVHDVGKIGIPERVLCKTGRLSDEEFTQIKRHPVIGYQILKDIPPLREMLPGVLYHHERWDGRGYPEGLAGEDIPLLGRILACADVFDAMSSTRSYRPGMPRQAVLDEIARCAGTQFDPEMARRFVTLDFAGYDELVQRHQARHGIAA